MSYETVARTNIGQAREVNEDAVYATTGEDWSLLCVADGMGGHAAGDIASEAAIEAFHETVEPELQNIPSTDTTQVLVDGAIAANEHLQTMIDENSNLKGMGTTLVAAIVKDGHATLVNVGDSRGYHVTETVIDQVTVDQSLVQQLVDDGDITQEEARNHPQRNVVSQALGKHESIDPDTFTVALEGWLLLCSDGLTEEVPEQDIRDIIVDAPDLEGAAEALIEQANENGGSDNISVAMGQFVP